MGHSMRGCKNLGGMAYIPDAATATRSPGENSLCFVMVS